MRGVFLLLALAAPLHAQTSSTVGLPAVVRDLVLPGTELEARPVADRKAPVIVRVLSVSPHGTACRYDLEFTGLDPGKFDLRPLLRRKDGSPTTDLPPIPVTVASVLPQGMPKPADLERGWLPRIGGYQLAVIAGAVLWVVGLLALLFVGRRRKVADEGPVEKPVSLADRLRPVVEAAIAGQRDPRQLAALERNLIQYWSRRLNLDHLTAVEALASLRRHPDVGPLLVQLEAWLHQPGPSEPADVNALLAPYRDLPPDALIREAA